MTNKTRGYVFKYPVKTDATFKFLKNKYLHRIETAGIINHQICEGTVFTLSRDNHLFFEAAESRKSNHGTRGARTNILKNSKR